MVQLSYQARVSAKKSEAKRLRREGNIPAILYGKKEKGQTIAISRREFEARLQQIPKGRLATTIFTLTSEEGKKKQAIIKDIQYHVTTYNVLHLDFEFLQDDTSVKVNVPVECIGIMDCPGLKLGGVVRQVIRSLPIVCTGKNIPESFTFDLKNLSMGDSLRLKDLSIPEGVRPLVDLNEVAVSIVKR